MRSPKGSGASSSVDGALAFMQSRKGRALLGAARAVRRHAHAPYSGFSVGAAVLDERGRMHVGCNVENASYGLSVCAERNAVAAAVAAGAKAVRWAVVVTNSKPLASPCGACRQVLAEFGRKGLTVVLAGSSGRHLVVCDIADLLPLSFRFRR